MIQNFRSDLKKLGNSEKAKHSMRFFKTGKGEYGEGDKFIGITVPEMRNVVKKYWKELTLDETIELLHSDIHEERLCAVIILTAKFNKGDAVEKEKIYKLYLANAKQVNNWDIVDSSAHLIVGPFLEDKDRSILKKLAVSKLIWERRIAMIATFHYIRKSDFKDALQIAKLLLQDKEDLIHKAVGWMLREMGKHGGEKEVRSFLKNNYKELPRTTLRYAIERFSDKDKLLKGIF